ncbi:hypothetical protein DPMN_141979 [Dreissena polymorpha]|uniref:Uncharacterized protein n=1 Tax=Dreissena polymorpha TaxID=45954 RepID=A0A9D4GAT0_DREPO|nr:hypothetical protein DPMN_141979 [Dreissena polymorpha]
MLTEHMNEITVDQSASGTFIMLTTATVSKRKLTQIPRKKIVIVISRNMFTTVITTLQISTSVRTLITYYRNDDDHRNDNGDYYFDNSKNKTNENDCNCYKNVLNNDSNDGGNHDCVDYLYNSNNNAEDRDCYKKHTNDYFSENDADYLNDCNGNFYGYNLAGRKVDNCNSRWNDHNVRVQRYTNCRVSYRNNRVYYCGDFLDTDYIYNEEHFYDIDEASETDTDSEHSDNVGDEDLSSWDNDEMVNYTYSGSDVDYNCRDKQCCYESDNECTDDEEYYKGQELDVVHGSDYDSDYDDYSDGELSDSYRKELVFELLYEYYSIWGHASDNLSDPDDYPINYGYEHGGYEHDESNDD